MPWGWQAGGGGAVGWTYGGGFCPCVLAGFEKHLRTFRQPGTSLWRGRGRDWRGL